MVRPFSVRNVTPSHSPRAALTLRTRISTGSPLWGYEWMGGYLAAPPHALR